MMRSARSALVVLFTALTLLAIPLWGHCNDAQQILEDVVEKNFQDPFRVALEVKTSKNGKEVGVHELWLMGKKIEGGNAFFLDFDKPEESKGMRILFRIFEDQRTEAYMFLPATKKTLPLATDDQSLDIGGTGLTAGDFYGFIPERDANHEVVKEEEFNGKQCYVIKTTPGDGKGHKLVWVSKDDKLMLKTEHYDEKGSMERSFTVVELFKTEKGQEFPRTEKIEIPSKNTVIKIRQENAVFGIEIADELMDPNAFGTYKWRI